MKIKQLLWVSVLLLSACSYTKTETNVTAQANYIESEEFAKTSMPFSEAVIYRDIIYASGQVGENADGLVAGGIGPETHQAMTNIKKVLEENGSSMDNIIKCTCMLADIADWAKMSEEYLKFFPNHEPARSAFATNGLALNARVEIECMAYLK